MVIIGFALLMSFNSKFNEDYILYRNIQLDWDQVEQDLSTVSTDQDRTVSITNSYNFIGEELTQIQQEYKKFGYTEHNTKMWKTTNHDVKMTFDWEKNINDQLPLDHAIATVTRQDVGQVLPWHIDRFFFLKKQFPEDNRPIWRFLLFLQDWKIGHVLQIKDSVLHHWKRGDVVVWQPNTEHLSANNGLEPKWTCNITGFLKV